jgi:hypothetical protein
MTELHKTLTETLQTLQSQGHVALNMEVPCLAAIIERSIVQSNQFQNIDKLLNQMIKHAHYVETVSQKDKLGQGYFTHHLKVIKDTIEN